MKYSQNELNDMANRTIIAKIFEPQKYTALILEVAKRTGLAAKKVEDKIRALASM